MKTIELFRMTDRQKEAWVVLMGNANYPTSFAEMNRAARKMWDSIKEQDPFRAFEIFESAQVLGMYDAANDAVFGVDWENEQT